MKEKTKFVERPSDVPPADIGAMDTEAGRSAQGKEQQQPMQGRKPQEPSSN